MKRTLNQAQQQCQNTALVMLRIGGRAYDHAGDDGLQATYADAPTKRAASSMLTKPLQSREHQEHCRRGQQQEENNNEQQ